MSLGDAKPKRAIEVSQAEASDAVCGVGRDVCRVDGADRRDHAKTAGIRRFTGNTVAGGAGAKHPKVSAPRDQFRLRGLPGAVPPPSVPFPPLARPRALAHTPLPR